MIGDLQSHPVFPETSREPRVGMCLLASPLTWEVSETLASDVVTAPAACTRSRSNPAIERKTGVGDVPNASGGGLPDG